MKHLEIVSPKRNKRLQAGWEGFFPYYAGYPESFATSVIRSALLSPDATILDPWNGSGTTTYAASQLGFHSIGQDINPVMVAVARARMLPPSEADALEPLARSIARGARRRRIDIGGDKLLAWFNPEAAVALRSIEATIRARLVGKLVLSGQETTLERLSSFAAAYYVGLFSVARELASPFASSNPTWVKSHAASNDDRVAATAAEIEKQFVEKIAAMAAALAQRAGSDPERATYAIRLADSTTPSTALKAASVDLVLTSPPYCTRIDYAASTRIELAIVSKLIETDTRDLSARMVGSIRVPAEKPEPALEWGDSCLKFLQSVRSHSSKASGGYYYSTHLDYFNKMSESLRIISGALKRGGAAILVVQDSYYKDVHNDLPTIISEMAEPHQLTLRRRDNFAVRHSMARINPRSSRYLSERSTTEAVLCLEKGV